MKVKDLQPNTKVDALTVEVIDVQEPRDFTNFRGSGRVASASVKDDTGEVKLTLWNDQIEQVEKGKKVVIENGWVKDYKGELQVSTGREGKITVK